MKLGFCGVGRWAQKLASAFRGCGAEIVAYDRRDTPLIDPLCPYQQGYLAGFGHYTPWRSQLADPSIDAIIAVATPEVTTEVAMACAAAGKPVMATKPLFDHPETIRAPFYVDFWRLWSEAHARGKTVRNPSIVLLGHGPFRSFAGAYDYGPHVLAAAMDWCGTTDLEITQCLRIDPSDYVDYAGNGGEQFQVGFRGLGCSVSTQFGNGAPDGIRSICGQAEQASRIGSEEKSAVLRRFCQSFLDDLSEGFVDTRLLNLSRDGMRMLRQVREMAVSA